ncbi:GAF sensor hybrid histidine kinase [Dissulfuribacter thermophilus]|uniref:histidine kinase n=1 Tax=Dissulfuribacter thermophilus TaxID=1156395 RepID=A0A1B9F3U7_9BACT|nr:HAMP domain-containing sensor histidine kinase [Dissulfuribacter thermophilus]OCC14592.1 GAF sensor hybrid histidine kinase [Dissulfuribacter thermophilus]
MGIKDRVLLIEDFEDTVKILKKLLEINGFEVDTALTLAEAYQKLHSTTPDVILLDINLPDGSGLDFLTELRSIYPDIPVIMLTAYTEIENAIRSLQHGVDDFIPKPFDSSYLLHSIAKAVEKHKLKDRLKKSEKFRIIGELASGVAHDFNNLLQSMNVHLMLLKDSLSSPEKAMEYINALEDVLENAISVCNRLNSMGRKQDIDLTVVELAQLVRETVLLTKAKWYHEPKKRGKHISIETDLKKDVYVKVNPAELREVFTNLIFNAVDAMDSSGEIKISVKKDKNLAICSVEDNGTGISQDVIDKIFDPFFTTKENGSGLGLSISFSIIQRFNGDISVKSIPGKGTTFMITLPCSKPAK